MKAKFTTLDIKLLVEEFGQKLLGTRVTNVYDIDSKTYLIKLNKTDTKYMLLLESGIRFHTTEFDWPKNLVPSGFAMKLRKHIKGKRLESVKQLGVDRIVDFQFGTGEVACHVILEVYDRGNIILTDFEHTILNIQRPRTDADQDVRFAVREKYPVHLAKLHKPLSADDIKHIIETAKKGENLKKVLTPYLEYGSHLLEHCLLEVGLRGNMKLEKNFQVDRDMDKLMEALTAADEFMQRSTTMEKRGYIITESEIKTSISRIDQEVLTMYSEFHPFMFNQYSEKSYTEFESFDLAVDEFFSKIKSQKQDIKIEQQKTTATKKLDYIKLDNKSRIEKLQADQTSNFKKALLIEMNQELVEEVISIVTNALECKLDWIKLKRFVTEASATDPTIATIQELNLNTKHITMLLQPPTEDVGNELDLTPMVVDIDLEMSAYANATRYHDIKKNADIKEAKTTNALMKAYKSAERKSMKVFKEIQGIATINKSRKSHWFERFHWFISSENYVVIGGRDQQQNELIVKKYMKPGDIYVHADLNGASSVVIKNPTGKPIPPLTLNEAGTMALCFSAAWNARVVTSSWWVYHDQVSKTAPNGEYLTTGSFMIRGKKNYLQPAALVYGLGFLFKLDESCLEKHKNERKVRGTIEEESIPVTEVEYEEVDLECEGDDDDNEVPSTTNDIALVAESIKYEPDVIKNGDENGESGRKQDFEEDGVHESLVRENKNNQKLKNTKNTNKVKCMKEEQSELEKSETSKKTQPLKRGQKSKLKKIKEKYADQDEEERQLRMMMSASDKGPKDKKHKKKDRVDNGPKNNLKQTQNPVFIKETNVAMSNPSEIDVAHSKKVEEMDEEVDNKQIQQDMELLDSLTGIPLPDDILHYCIPVCAPWSVIQNYKFKIKLTPGNSKKGKSAKSAIAVYMNDKSTTSLEKNLLRSLKDSDLAGNMPGKVKVTMIRSNNKK